jgi:hypothetical protein
VQEHLQCLTANLKADFGKMQTGCQVKLLHFATPRHEPVDCFVMCKSMILQPVHCSRLASASYRHTCTSSVRPIIGPIDTCQAAAISRETGLCACSLASVGSFLRCWLLPIHQVLRLATLHPLCRGNRMHGELRQLFLTHLTRVIMDMPSAVFTTK